MMSNGYASVQTVDNSADVINIPSGKTAVDPKRKVPRGHIMGKLLDVDENGSLWFQNGESREKVRVVVRRDRVHVGCVRLTKKALALLTEKINRGSYTKVEE